MMCPALINYTVAVWWYRFKAESLRIRGRRWRERNKDKVRQWSKEWVSNNREKVRERARKAFHKNLSRDREKRRLQSVRYRAKHREKFNAYHRRWRKTINGSACVKKIKSRITSKLRNSLSMRIRTVVRGKCLRQFACTMELLGCTTKFLKSWLEQQFKDGMTWENYGVGGWEIDHIIPCAKFDLSKASEQRKCFHYTNLQPLWKADNLLKRAKLLTQQPLPLCLH